MSAFMIGRILVVVTWWSLLYNYFLVKFFLGTEFNDIGAGC